MSGILDIFKALADEGRLRILRSIDQAELSVAELVQALEMPQSSVSRHLKPMREAGLVAARRDGTSVFYNRGPLFNDEAFSQILTERLQDLSVAHRDAAAVERVVDLRRRRSLEFFDEVADLGCGEGVLALMLSRFAKKVVAVDQSEKMLNLVAEKAAEQNTLDRLELKRGNLESLDLPEESFDALFLSQSLHHTLNPDKVVGVAAKGLKHGGQMIILDLVRHEHEWAREEWADQWLGFDPLETREWFTRAGLETVALDSLVGATPDLSVLIAVGKRK
jgi:DNA-binding transcriptional ArsR family regulator